MNNPTLAAFHSHNRVIRILIAILLLAVCADEAAAQSTELEFPTAVRSAVISGRIAARDIGDPRLTKHFYAFTGTPGDLIINVESRNLNGDVDVFTAGSLRPLAKVSLYASESATSVSKSIHLRHRESLILRVEARSTDDQDGTYSIRFEGAFEPLMSDLPTPEAVGPVVSETARVEKKGRRVTSVGGRIDEPETEAAASPNPPQPSSTPSAADASAAPSAPAEKTPEPIESASTTKPEPVRSARSRRPRSSSRPSRTRTPPRAAKESPPPAESEQPRPEPPQPAASARLIIETRDGMRIERYMSTVRRVTVEKGQIVIVMNDGKVDRQLMTNVLRMSIEP